MAALQRYAIPLKIHVLHSTYWFILEVSGFENRIEKSFKNNNFIPGPDMRYANVSNF